MTESGLPRNGAMLTLLINVLQIGHGSLSLFEGTVSPGRRSGIEESLLNLDPMGRQRPWRLVCGVHVVFRLAVSLRKSEYLPPFDRMRKVLPYWLESDRGRISVSETTVVEVWPTVHAFRLPPIYLAQAKQPNRKQVFITHTTS
jgi:hypothetical protein